MTVLSLGVDLEASEQFEALLRAVSRCPAFVNAMRSWTEDEIRSTTLAQLRNGMLSHPDLETLLEWDGVEVRDWVIMMHNTIEWATDRPRSVILFPSRVTSPMLLNEAARRARRRGSDVLEGGVAEGDHVHRAAYHAAGMMAEMRRIILRLDDPRRALPQRVLARTLRGYRVRRADASDRLNLMLLSTACVPMMYPEWRGDDMTRIQERFFNFYGRLDISENGPFYACIAETLAGDLAGAVLVNAHEEKLPDGTWQAHIMDVSVLPEHWDRAIPLAMGVQAIADGLDAGTRYASGHISVQNDRVSALAQRFGFVTEHTRYVRLLYKEEGLDGR